MRINIDQLFRAAMTSKGIINDGVIIADGKLHRFHIEGDKPKNKNGWFVLYPDGLPSGAFGSWKSGVRAVLVVKTIVELQMNVENIREGGAVLGVAVFESSKLPHVFDPCRPLLPSRQSILSVEHDCACPSSA